MPRRYWLMKSEPDTFSIDDLARVGVEHWDGVRNYQARNLLRDELRVGDRVLFYHSNASPPGVAGVAEVARAGYPDHTAFDPRSPYHDPKSDPDNPRWFMVDVRFVEKFPALVPLAVLQATPGLEDMMVTRKGMRLSVQPVTPAEWKIVLRLGRKGRGSDAAAKRRAAQGSGPRSAQRSGRQSAQRSGQDAGQPAAQRSGRRSRG